MSGTISTPTIEISKIQLRRGNAEDLPGAPTTGNPTLPTTPLDTGELAFTTDTGQLFVGPSLQDGGPSLTRPYFPFQNIEVLTENSNAYLTNLFNYFYRDVQTGFYVSVPLNITNANEWQTLNVVCGDGIVPCLINATANFACVQINYYLYDSSSTVRTGKLSCAYNGNSGSPLLEDEFITFPNTSLNSPDSSNPNLVYGSIQFRAVTVANGNSQNVVIEYQNIGTSTPTMFFRLERGASEGGNTICSASSSAVSQNTVQTFTFQVGNTPVLLDTWDATNNIGMGQYYVFATLNSPNNGSQISLLYIGTDGTGVNYMDDALYFSPNVADNVLDYTTTISNGIISFLANTIISGAVATVTIFKFPVYSVS